MADPGMRYTYDGTFEGFLCAVLAALRSGRVPASSPGCIKVRQGARFDNRQAG